MDHNQQGQGPGRRHFHRGRRGPDRRGPDRRGPQPPTAEPGSGRGDVDVEQIMRDIRARIAQRHGVELTNQQVQELAARRLESILDPRGVKPALLDQLRRAAGSPPDAVAAAPPDPPYEFEDSTLYGSHRGLMRFIRRLLNPILKLFFNPNPLIRALNIQARLNAEAAAREAERDRQQAEWNALHYEIVHRTVTEIARVTLELQSLSMRIESLAAKVDFNERRVRGIEGAMHQARPAGRREDGRRDEGRREVQEAPLTQVVVQAGEGVSSEPAPASQGTGQPIEGTRRRRRRRRGRRSGIAPVETVAGAAGAAALDVEEPDEGADDDEVAGLIADAPPRIGGHAERSEGANEAAYIADPNLPEASESAGLDDRADALGLTERAGEASAVEHDAATRPWEQVQSESQDEENSGGLRAEDAFSEGPVAAVEVHRQEVEETVVVTAEAQPRREEEPVSFEPVVPAPPSPPDPAAVDQSEPAKEEPRTPAPPERHDIERSDR